MTSNKIRSATKFLISSLVLVVLFSVSKCKKEEEKIMKVRNDSISNISSVAAKANATIIDIGQGISQHGHCWSTEEHPDKNDSKTENGTVGSPGPYSSSLTGLSPDTKYYVRAYIENTGTYIYSFDELSFITLSAGLPEVTTGTVKTVSTTSATITGNLDSLGTGATSVIQHGHCWSKETTTPTINDKSTSLGPRDSTGAYESGLVGLTEGTLYYVRAYATNTSGTSYGDTLSFSTNQAINEPTVSTEAVSSVTATSATCGGNVTSDGGSAVTERGVCWNTTGTPEITDNIVPCGSGTGVFSCDITGLDPITEYYVRAYATNSAGTGYGTQESFTTSQVAGLPTVVTTAVTGVSKDAATVNGNVTSDGGNTVTARGVCWNTTGTPEITDNIVPGGSGTGVFSCDITGLDPVTKYYVRTYATNSAGTGYSTQMNFTTLSDDPNAGWEPGDDWTDTRDDQTYGTAQLGNQVWMTENLNYGIRIDGIYNSTNNAYVQKYCCMDNELYCDDYGGLYQWDEMMDYDTLESTQGICPDGWHIPSDDEWKDLEMYVGMSQVTADSLYYRGTDEAYDLMESGFTGFEAKLAGLRHTDGNYYDVGTNGYFWSSSTTATSNSLYRGFAYDSGKIFRFYLYNSYGISVRCVKD